MMPSSENIDITLMFILLKSVCHLCPPYPNGWTEPPLYSDKSISADVARLMNYRKNMVEKNGVNEQEFRELWTQITDVLIRIGGTPINVMIERMNQEKISADAQVLYIRQFRDWHKQECDIASRESEIAAFIKHRGSNSMAYVKRGAPPAAQQGNKAEAATADQDNQSSAGTSRNSSAKEGPSRMKERKATIEGEEGFDDGEFCS